jgi:RNA polymerase primary sigma factor
MQNIKNTKKFIDTSEESISKYLKDVRKLSTITVEEEVELSRRIKEGDTKAMEKLVNSNLRFVITIAKDYQNQGIPLSDLINEGNYGLIKAAQKFDPERGFKFISYAVWWVKQSIIQSLNDHARTVRLPVNVNNNISKIKKEMSSFEQEFGRLPVDDEIGMDLSILNQPTCISLNEKINEDGDEMLDIIEDNTFEKPGETLINNNSLLKEELDNVMNCLSDRERKIIELYFGLNGTPLTLEEIGDEFGLTKERIRQVKEKALRRIRFNSKNLLDHFYKK